MDATYWRLDPKLVGNAILATGQFFDWFCQLAGSDMGDKFHVGRYVFDGDDGPLGPQMDQAASQAAAGCLWIRSGPSVMSWG